jgi:hypothetical protein
VQDLAYGADGRRDTLGYAVFDVSAGAPAAADVRERVAVVRRSPSLNSSQPTPL